MRTAVLLTGALRTITKTIQYLKKNVLCTEAVHVFACVQNDTAESDTFWTAWFQEQLGPSLKSIYWFSLQNHPEWLAHRENLLRPLGIDEGWKDYLRRSGSMIEYFQLHLANIDLCREEGLHGHYSYVVRARTDSVFLHPVDFHWLHWTDQEVEARLQRLRELLPPEKHPALLDYFMITVLSDDATFGNLGNIATDMCVPNPADRLPTPDLSCTAMNDYLKHGRYILTFRKNNLYVVRRDLFYMLPALGTMYGLPQSPAADIIWFNAECQFRSACYYVGLSIFEYSTHLDETSLSPAEQWDEAMFFDPSGNPMPQMLYCVIRK